MDKILGAIAALITAVAALITALALIGFFWAEQKQDDHTTPKANNNAVNSNKLTSRNSTYYGANKVRA